MDVQSARRLTARRGVPVGGRLPVRVRLSLLMLLMYAAPGAVVPIFSLRLSELGFSPIEIGLCCATQAIGSMLAPLLAGQIADRWIPAERCLSMCALVEALLLWLMSTLTTPAGVFAAALVFWLVMAPAMTLTTAVAFANLPNPARDFGRVRLWGTVGWVLPMWLLGYWLSGAATVQQLLAVLRPENPRGVLADAFRLGALMAALFGLYTLTLPHTQPRTSTGAAPLAAFRLLRGRAFFVYAVCTLGVSAVLPFSTQLTPLLLKSLNVSATWLPRLLTIAQGSEVLSLAVLPAIMHRLGNRLTMRMGILAAVLTLTCLMVGRPLPLAVGGLGLYGLCISCYLVAGQMYLNRRARPNVRASAQAMHSVLCGVGLLIGNVLVGVVHRGFAGDFAASFAVAAFTATALLAFFVAGFPAEPVTEPASSP
jgi:predicted MFS family arabinose efflux permease